MEITLLAGMQPELGYGIMSAMGILYMGISTVYICKHRGGIPHGGMTKDMDVGLLGFCPNIKNVMVAQGWCLFAEGHLLIHNAATEFFQQDWLFSLKGAHYTVTNIQPPSVELSAFLSFIDW